MTYYEILEVTETASTEVIHMAYKALAKKYHPDVFTGDATFADEQMKQINTAYKILSDPALRIQYDAFLHRERSDAQKAKGKQRKPKKEKKPPTLKRSVITVVLLMFLLFVSCLSPYFEDEVLSDFALFYGNIDFMFFNLIIISVPLLICAIKKVCSLDFICRVSAINSAVMLAVSIALYAFNISDFVFLGGAGAIIYYFINKHILFQMHQRIQKRKHRIAIVCTVIFILLFSLFNSLLVISTIQNSDYMLIKSSDYIVIKRDDLKNSTRYYIGDVDLCTDKSSTYFVDEYGNVRKINYTSYYMDKNGNLINANNK